MTNDRNWFCLLLIASLIGILTATLSPFNFVIPETLDFSTVIQKFHHGTNIKDYVRNIFLFIPLGISLGGILGTYKHQPWLIILLAGLLSGIVLSSSIELSQITLNTRVSSISDIVCNSLGGTLGTTIYTTRQEFTRLARAITDNKYSQVNQQFLLTLLIGYCLTFLLGARLLKHNLNLSNWNDNYYLAIGSEVTGRVTWNGYLANLEIYDRALNSEEITKTWNHSQLDCNNSSGLITAYNFDHHQEYYEDNCGQSPNLTWQHNSFPAKDRWKPINSQQSVLFKHRHSLISQTATKNINQSIKQSGEFSLSLAVATNRLKQIGPARIISLADSVGSRNLLIGQTGKNLVLFLRTPITGHHASQPSFLIPNLFADYKLHHLLIIYKQDKITFYLDQLQNQYTFKFQLANSARLYLPWTSKYPGWRIDVTKPNLFENNLIFYSCAFLPVAIMIRILLAQLLIRNKK